MKRTLLKSFLAVTVAVVALAATVPAFAIDDSQTSETKLVVDINHADAQDLMELPGVGAKVAERIVAYREENGPFEQVEELMNVRGIGEKTFLKLKPFLTLGDEPAQKKK